MDSTYIGKYGQLRVLGTELLGKGAMYDLEQKWDDFLKILSGTTYRREIDEFSALYRGPDLIDVVLNAHMMRIMENAMFAVPPGARSFVKAYLNKWDIENIKLILSAKVLNYPVEQTEKFLMVQHDVPAGLLAGIITRDDYKNIIAQKDIEGVVNSIVKYGYGTILLKYLDSAKRSNDISEMILALDLYYYDALLGAYKLHNNAEGNVGDFIAESIDVRNMTNMLKALLFGFDRPQQYIIKGGKISEKEIADAVAKGADAIIERLPFKISEAIELYRREQFISYIEVAQKRELYRKYIQVFRRSGFSLAFILAYMLMGELERDELRNIWFSKYYGISSERYKAMQVATYVLGEN
ncbi:MAG: V-type ATPase subunit [Candidatus Marsarchaeota archaeon]|jgi:V/A-type H+-transporting ATPase subunit C|nr:V-type ATPase subunit [Candidatus Marsarchaeota archaeon]MCL5419009.1 V-type ATPase subunit [Candidatus Marsarchaeota archaeon]